MRGRGRRRGRGRAGVARGGVHDDARVFVIAHEFRNGDLAGEVVHDAQIHIGSVKLGLEISGDGFAGGARVARFADEQVVGGNRVGQRGQLGGGHAVGGKVGDVGVRRRVDVLAVVAGLHVASAHEVAHGKIHGVGEGVVLGFHGVGVNGIGNRQRGGAHGLSRGLFVLRHAAGVLRLTLGESLDVGDVEFEVGVSIGKGLKRLPSGRSAVADSLDGQIHGELVELFCVHSFMPFSRGSHIRTVEMGEMFKKSEKPRKSDEM